MAQTVGERIAQSRRLLSVVVGRDVSQDDFAGMAGLAPGSMSQWEKGHKRASRDTLERLVAVLNAHGMDYITLGWLDYGEGEGPPPLGTAPPARPSKPVPKREPKPTSSAQIAAERQAARRRRAK